MMCVCVCLFWHHYYLPGPVIAVVVEVATSSPQFPESLSSGGLLGPDLHPGQVLLWGGHEEWRMQASGEEE